jgi:hypothetical protein
MGPEAALVELFEAKYHPCTEECEQPCDIRRYHGLIGALVIKACDEVLERQIFRDWSGEDMSYIYKTVFRVLWDVMELDPVWGYPVFDAADTPRNAFIISSATDFARDVFEAQPNFLGYKA